MKPIHRTSSVAPILAGLTAALAPVALIAQEVPVYHPVAVADLPDATPSLFEATGRVQQFLTPDALGIAPGKPLVVQGIALRFDGPTATTGLPRALASLTVRVGVTQRSIQAVGAVFDDNLTQPLTTALVAINHTVPVDTKVQRQAEAWGGSGNGLRLTFPTPVAVTVPGNGCVVIEFEVIAAPGHVPGDSRLDFAAMQRLPGSVGGSSIAEGVGCAYMPSGNQPQIETAGNYDIGTSFTVTGEGFHAQSLVVTWLTSLLSIPGVIPGSPGCWSYLDLNSGGTLFTTFADAAGTIGSTQPPVPIPPAPALCGSLLYLQSAGTSLITPHNPTGILTSNYRTIRVGCRGQGVPSWYVAGRSSAAAGVADVSMAGSLAIRIE